MKNYGFLVKGMVVLTLWLMLGLVQATPAMAARYIIYPEADSYVNSQNPDNNYGTATQFYATYFSDYLGSPLTERAFLKFDLSVIANGSTIKAASLHLYVTSNGGHPGPTANLYHVGDGWTALEITWNNQPPPGIYLAACGPMFWGSYYAWNLFESKLWDPSQDLAKHKVSLMVKLLEEGQPVDFIGYSFCSSNNGTSKPYLEVTTVADPAPATLLLLNN
jgi:hypothetical protein